MSAILIGLAAVLIYAIGVFIGLWLGRGYAKQEASNWNGAIPISRESPPKPMHNPNL